MLSSRPAQPDDAPSIARIYNEGIADRVATFETEPRSTEDVRGVLETHRSIHPAVVAELGTEVVAFAWTSAYRPREAYAGVAEFSVYVARYARNSGAGTAVLSALLEAAQTAGYWKLVSRIFPENEPSRRLCARLGFREVGVYQRHGRLDGEWKDCVIVERLLGDARV
jgi:phosphinothricin acetyltransferase